MCRTWIGTYPFVKRSKKVCLIVTWRALGQSLKGENLTLLKCRLALQKCQMGSWTPNVLPCSGAFWTLLLGLFDLVSTPRRIFILSLWLFLIYFLDNSSFFRNNYLVDKYPKINLDKVQIIHNFIGIQSSLLFLCMHPYFIH